MFRVMCVVVSLVVVLTVCCLDAAAQCGFNLWFTHNKTNVFKFRNTDAYYFVVSDVTIDADGAPNAYHADNVSGLDALANAGYPKGKWRNVLVADSLDTEKPFIQKEGPYAGYFVSKTSLQDGSKAETDVSRYVDSTKVSYLAIPSDFYRMKGTGRLGSFGVAINLETGKSEVFIIADIAKSGNNLGEISVNLAEKLSGSVVNARNGEGKPRGNVMFIVFPESFRQQRWPVGYDDMVSTVHRLIKSSTVGAFLQYFCGGLH